VIAEPRPALAHEHPPLGHHFNTLEQEHDTAEFGMWIFLMTELMLFGGLFVAYIFYRTLYPDGFAEGSRQLELIYGGPNTVILIVSSFTMVLAVRSAQRGAQRRLFWSLVATAALGVVFMVIKGAEYYQHFVEGTVPGLNWTYAGPQCKPGATVLFRLLRAYRPALRASLDRHRASPGHGDHGQTRRISHGAPHPGGDARSVLVLRRHGVDVLEAAALPVRVSPVMLETERIIPARTAASACAVLIVLTLANIFLAQVDLRGWNTLVGLLISAAQAALSAIFLMHLRWSRPTTRLVAMVALMWLAILIGGTLDDLLTVGCRYRASDEC
jgi:caa(3)-type oxidase subunit IV